jgi:hypothetical protein
MDDLREVDIADGGRADALLGSDQKSHRYFHLFRAIDQSACRMSGGVGVTADRRYEQLIDWPGRG